MQIEMKMLVDELDATLKKRIDGLFLSGAKINASIHGISPEAALNCDRLLMNVFSEEFGMGFPLSDDTVNALKEARNGLLGELLREGPTMEVFLNYIKVAQIVKSDRWARFRLMVERDFAEAKAVDIPFVCRFVELEFVINGAFELLKMPSGVSVDSCESLQREQGSFLCGGGLREERLLDALEKAYRNDLTTDLEEFGVAWIEEMRDCFREISDGSKNNRAILLVGCPELQLNLVEKLWGRDVEQLDGRDTAQIQSILARNDRSRLVMKNANKAEWALLRALADRQSDHESRFCHLIGLLPNGKSLQEMDPGTFSRFFPFSLTKLEPLIPCILSGMPTQGELLRLLQSVKDGTYGHFVDLLILAVLHASRV